MTTLKSSNSFLEDGIYAAVLTPLKEDYSCDRGALISHCKALLAKGCKGIVLFGTTGEGPSFSIDERLSTLDELRKEIPREKILMGSGGANIPEVVQLAKGALKRGCNIHLITPPSFFKNVEEMGTIAFYREIIRRVGDPNLKVILYHIPQFTGVPITLKVIEMLTREFPEQVIGLKESEGNPKFAKAVTQAFPQLKVFVGNERQIIESVSFKGAGAICGLPNLFPELIVSLYDMGKKGMRENPKELDGFFKAMKDLNFIAAFKAVLEKRDGSIWHRLRPPLMPLSQQDRDEFTIALQKEGLIPSRFER